MFLPTGKGAFNPGLYFTDHVTPLRGLRAGLGPETTVLYEKGCDLLGEDRSGFPAAVDVAAQADVAVVVVAGRSGLHRGATVGEARDATDLRLTGLQEQLVASVAATGTPTVVVVISGRAHVLTEVADKASALLVAWPLGEQGGNALADILLGKAEPGGRLPVSLPARHRAGPPVLQPPFGRLPLDVLWGLHRLCPYAPFLLWPRARLHVLRAIRPGH